MHIFFFFDPTNVILIIESIAFLIREDALKSTAIQKC